MDKASLKRQKKESEIEDRTNLFFHKMLLNGKLPLAVVGGCDSLEYVCIS